MARAQRDVPLEAVLRDPLRGLRIEGDLLLRAYATKDLHELLRRRRLDLDLVLDASQECFIHQRRGRPVRREDEQDVERDFDLATVAGRQEVDVAVERDDPAVEELVGRCTLTAEVVDEEHAAARLHLERRLVDLRVRVENEVEVLERQLTADLDERARNRDPASVEARVKLDERAVTRRVVHADDLLTDKDRVRHDDAALQHRGERLRDRRLAGAGWTEEEDRLRAVDGRPELAEREIRQHEMREGFAQTFQRDLHGADGLRSHASDV